MTRAAAASSGHALSLHACAALGALRAAASTRVSGSGGGSGERKSRGSESTGDVATVLQILELLQEKADDAQLLAAATGLVPVLESAIASGNIPAEHLPAAHRALGKFEALRERADAAEAAAKARAAADGDFEDVPPLAAFGEPVRASKRARRR